MKSNRRSRAAAAGRPERDAVGAHERTSRGRRLPPPLPELNRTRGPALVIPQRERITFLVLLADVLAPWTGPANDLAGAARQIRNQMEVAAAA